MSSYIKVIVAKIIIIKPIVTGKKFFHVKYIRWSYRIRGNVARTHTNRVANSIVFSTRMALFIITG